MIRRWIQVTIAGTTLALIGAGAADAATFRATKTGEGGPNSLRGTINKANERDGNDTVVLAPRRGQGSTFNLNRCVDPGAEEDLNADGDLDHTDVDSKLTISGRGNTIRNRCDGERILHTVGGGGLEVRNVTLRDGDSLLGGGAIQAAALVVRTSRFTGNEAVNSGGAIHASNESTIARSVITGNRSGASGGGVTLSGGGTISASLIRGNRADGGGGGLFKEFGPATISKTAISGNTTDGAGGGIRIAFGLTTIRESAISGNHSAVNGGAIWKSFDPLNLTNTTVSGNTTDQTTGGIRSDFGGGSLSHVTLFGNDGTGVGVAFDGFTFAGSIIAGNSGASQCAGGGLASGGHNIASDASCGLTGDGDQPDTDPLLFGLRNNGGPTLTHALRNGSPAINRGAPASDPDCVETDQRGVKRRGRCDVGAYERVKCRGAIVNRVGTPGSDTLAGTNGRDGILGLGGRDKLVGKRGKDGLCGNGGRDRLSGGGGRDKCDGGPGRDRATGCEVVRSVP